MASAKIRNVLQRELQMLRFKSAEDPEILRQFRKVFRFSFWFGGIPFTLNSGHHLRLVVWMLPYSVLCSSAFLLMTAFLVWSDLPLVHKTVFTKFLFLLRAAPFALTLLSWLYFVIAHRATIDSVLQKLMKIEKALFDSDAKQRISYNLMYGAGMQIFALSRLLYLPMTNVFENPAKLIFLLMYPYAQCYQFGALEHFFFLVDSLWHYLDILVRQVRTREVVLVRLCAIHDNLADVRSCIQKAYSFPLLCVVFSSFVSLNVNIFLWIKLTRVGGTFYFAGGALLPCLPILRIAYACGRATSKGNEFYSALHKIMKADPSCKLLYNIIAATTTYSILLLQIGENL